MFPDSTHVRNVGLKSSSDPTVWSFAVENDFVIVSKVEALIRRKIGYISKFIEDDVVSFLAIS